MPSRVAVKSRSSRGRAASLGLALAILVTLVAPACSNSSGGGGLAPQASCHQNSDCQTGLICALGECRSQCTTSADCGTGGLCVNDGTNPVCEYSSDSCNTQSDCTAPLACASDYRCRDLCTTATDCNVLGITDDVCATDANGVHYCAPMSQVNGAGMINDPPPAGADTSVPVVEPVIDASVSDATSSGDGMTTTLADGGDATMTRESPDASDASAANASDAGALDASDAGPVCAPTCNQGQACLEGPSGPACTACGSSSGLPCCDGQMCGANLTCTAESVCECGSANQACCGGNTCNSGLSCNVDDAGEQSTCACGNIGSRCCAGVDGGMASCSDGLACAGSKCTCILQFAAAGIGSDPGVVLRTDGTVWAAGPEADATFTEMTAGSGPLIATSIAASEGYEGSAPPIGCAIVGGGVWCFPTGGTLSDSTDLGAGLGPTDSTSSPVQVLIPSGGGSPLTNVTQLAGGLGLGGANFCAVTSDGSAWCWGFGANGQLGNGGTSDSSFASQVMANASTPFANVVEVRISYEAACARTTNGSVWCWGTNGYGELGVLPSTTPHSYYPIQVPFSDASAQEIATRLGAGRSQTFCAIMQDTSVVCWGYNSSGQAGAPTSENSSYTGVGPTSVLVAAGGSPLTGIVDLAGDEADSMCAKTSDLAILCWGADASGPYPVAYNNAADTAAIGIVALLSESQSGLGYLDPDGLLIADGQSSGPTPPCTNLLP